MPTTFGTSMPSRGDMASPENLRTLAQRAESLGFDSVWVSDHIILPRKVDSFYPYAADGVATFRPDEDYYDPLATLNFLAGCTQKIRLGTHVLILPYRNPVVTAKMLSTLDVLSGGRVILGAGVGWMEEEFQALGLDTYAQRGAVTDEYIQLFKELWTKDEPEFQGEHYQLSGMGFMPKPVQKPHPPIVRACISEESMVAMGKAGRPVLIGIQTLDTLRHRFGRYREALENSGFIIGGVSPDGNLIETGEVGGHPFMVGVQYHPEFQSRPNRPHPLFSAFIDAARKTIREGSQQPLPLPDEKSN